VYGSPQAKGIMSFQRVNALLKEAAKIPSIRWIYFEGGEPFLVYPLLLKGIHAAKQLGFEVGVITNGSFARNHGLLPNI
jgi:pyruvate-formate lyase-activating enzyme